MRKVALVTGGSRGLGRETAVSLGALGYAVAVNYLKEEASAHDVVKLINGDAIAVRGDVGTPDDVLEIASIIEKRWGRLDAIINNAGITRDSLLLKLSEEEWDAVIKTNLKGCFNTARALLPLMIKSGGGHIVNISSRSGLAGRAGQAAYAASKSALLGLTKTLAAELSEYNIKVNALLPGYMPTEMGMRPNPPSPPFIKGGTGGFRFQPFETAKKESLLGRLSAPKEAAGFIAWLIGTEGITGQVFTLDSRL